MESFAGALNEYLLSLMQVWSMLSISFKLEQSCHFHSCTLAMAGKCYKFLFQQIKISSSFSTINLCFVINVLNNKTIILLNLAEYRLILKISLVCLVG